MMPPPALQPSSSSLATAIAAAFRICNYPGVLDAENVMSQDKAKKVSQLVGDCAKIIHETVAGSAGSQGT